MSPKLKELVLRLTGADEQELDRAIDRALIILNELREHKRTGEVNAERWAEVEEMAQELQMEINQIHVRKIIRHMW